MATVYIYIHIHIHADRNDYSPVGVYMFGLSRHTYIHAFLPSPIPEVVVAVLSYLEHETFKCWMYRGECLLS